MLPIALTPGRYEILVERKSDPFVTGGGLYQCLRIEGRVVKAEPLVPADSVGKHTMTLLFCLCSTKIKSDEVISVEVWGKHLRSGKEIFVTWLIEPGYVSMLPWVGADSEIADESGRVGGSCKHPRCGGGPCRSLTKEALTPTDADLEFGRKLVAEGWIQTSRRYRCIARVKPEFASAESLLRPEVADTAAGKILIEAWSKQRRWVMDRHGDLVETQELTVRQFAGFRAAGGDIW